MFPARRAFLFLQGPRSRFLNQLGQRLSDDGHKVVKVNFTAGDQFGWHGKLTETFRDPWPMLGEFVTDLWRRHGITDQVAFGDCRPAHKEVISAARRRGIRNHILAPGYLQSYWTTLEREGVDGYSLLPRDADWYQSVGPTIPHALPPRPFQQPLASRAFRRIGYQLADLANPLLFRHARSHTRLSNDIDCRRLIGRGQRQAATRCRQLLEERQPFYLFPLQHDDDSRIRWHSPYADMHDGVARVVSSFARFAPGRARLIILDPMGTAVPGYVRRLRDLARETDLGERLVFMPGADLKTLIDHASGLVTVNGQEGLAALERDCPTLALGQAIYRLPGLTSTSTLDDFWRHPIGPERRLFRNFASVVIHATQINGGFYDREGIDLAVINAVAHLTDNISPIERLLWDSRLPVAS
ncbi:capsule biosynthesis protein CapA [Salinicola halimionae]|uniref:capsular polysaccharide export protein, LipB/KpsS family n=1 Tax=Salinicola halimionae TaxID=1949081 RepID=UPI000DA17FD9|nr:capsule biosynthesis protein CapA [Salinicola halimionae]